MAEWRETTLGELVEESGGTIKTGPFGTTLKASEYVSQGVPVISVGEVGYGRLRVSDKTPRVGAETATRLSEYLLSSGDIVFGRKGAVDRSAFVTSEQDGWFLGSDGLRVRFGASVDKVDSAFFSYQLQSQASRTWLLQHASGSTLLSMNQGTLARVPLVVPGLAEQRAIADVLGTLDDKIAANTKLATTADELSRIRFKQMVGGGSLVPLSDTARFVNGRNFTKGATGSGRVVIRIAELNSGLTGSTVRNEVDAKDDNVARPGDLLFAWSGSLTLRRWFHDEGVVNQHIFKVLPEEGYPLWLVNQLVQEKLAEFKAIAADKATTMGHIQRRHLDEPVPMPSAERVAAADAGMSALWDRALLAERENLQLAATRDALLPALMSGKLTVRQAEDIAGDPSIAVGHLPAAEVTDG